MTIRNISIAVTLFLFGHLPKFLSQHLQVSSHFLLNTDHEESIINGIQKVSFGFIRLGYRTCLDSVRRWEAKRKT